MEMARNIISKANKGEAKEKIELGLLPAEIPEVIQTETSVFFKFHQRRILGKAPQTGGME